MADMNKKRLPNFSNLDLIKVPQNFEIVPSTFMSDKKYKWDKYICNKNKLKDSS